MVQLFELNDYKAEWLPYGTGEKHIYINLYYLPIF